jgi:hypothetical protein
MIIKTYLVPKIKGLKRAFLQTKSLIICSTVILGLVFPNHQTLAQIVTVEMETFVTLDQHGNFVLSFREEPLYLTPDSKAVFFGGTSPTVSEPNVENVVFTSTAESTPISFFNMIDSSAEPVEPDELVFSGIRHVGYLTRDYEVFVVNVDTGESEQQGSDVDEILGVTADGRVLYLKEGDDNFYRLMLGNTEIYKYGDDFGGYGVRDNPYSFNISMNPSGDDVFIILETTDRDEFGRTFDVLFKNGAIIQVGNFDQVYPYGEDEFLVLTDADELYLNGTELIYGGPFSGNGTLRVINDDIYIDGDIGTYFYDVDAEGEKLSFLFNRSQAELFTLPLAETSRGDLLYSDDAIQLYDKVNGEVRSVLKVGDEVDGRLVTGLQAATYQQVSEDQLVVRGRLDSEGDGRVLFRVDLYAETGPVYTVSELCPEIPAGFIENQSFEDWANYPDPFTSSDPIDLQEGPCGGIWRDRIWIDRETKAELSWKPGTPDHTDDAVQVENIDLVISGELIELKSAHLTGSLVVNSPFTLNNNSSLDSLSLNADLVTNGVLSLTGVNIWNGGDIGGEGSIDLLESESNSMTLNGKTLNLGLNLSNTGTILHNSSQLNLTESGGKITS